ncbi:hypothetical protein XIS1_1790054 [Xenorhabdus innexi]|uniref:Uncharacterized protein n=1 Tax=Xenorhabdus innexi TaxID=290109 RepID=A0A1N6MWK2_9GAMM|nr:hypothetical protein XIS1_1790054 [Xenorhabdus innexi]
MQFYCVSHTRIFCRSITAPYLCDRKKEKEVKKIKEHDCVFEIEFLENEIVLSCLIGRMVFLYTVFICCLIVS